MIPISKLPAWVNAPWFNTALFLMMLAAGILEVSEQPWAPVWVRIFTFVVAACGLAVKPKT